MKEGSTNDYFIVASSPPAHIAEHVALAESNKKVFSALMADEPELAEPMKALTMYADAAVSLDLKAGKKSRNYDGAVFKVSGNAQVPSFPSLQLEHIYAHAYRVSVRNHGLVCCACANSGLQLRDCWWHGRFADAGNDFVNGQYAQVGLFDGKAHFQRIDRRGNKVMDSGHPIEILQDHGLWIVKVHGQSW